MLSVTLSLSAVLSRSAVLSAAGMLCGAVLCSCSSCRHRLRIVSTLRFLYHPYPGSPSVFQVSCTTPGNVRLLYATTVRQTARRARGLQRPCGRSSVGCRHLLLLSRLAHAPQMLCPRYAHALLVRGMRSPGSQGQRQGQRQREMLREKERANLPCPVVRVQYTYGVRHKKSILGNEKSEIGNEKTQ